MHRPVFRPLMVGFALALTPTAAACGSPETVSPLPARTAAPSASGLPSTVPSAVTSAAPSTSPTQRGRPAGTNGPKAPVLDQVTSSPTYPSSCQGVVRYDVDVPRTEFELLKSLCFKAGAVLRLQNIGPGLVTVEPASLVSRSYEGAVHTIRLTRKGTVDVRIEQDDRVDTITVVIT